jgi:hypothetical protein
VPDDAPDVSPAPPSAGSPAASPAGPTPRGPETSAHEVGGAR